MGRLASWLAGWLGGWLNEWLADWLGDYLTVWKGVWSVREVPKEMGVLKSHAPSRSVGLIEAAACLRDKACKRNRQEHRVGLTYMAQRS